MVKLRTNICRPIIVVVVAVSLAFLLGCNGSQKKSSGEAAAPHFIDVGSQSAPSSALGEEFPRFKYPGYEPEWDEEYYEENRKVRHRMWIAKHYSIAAYFCSYYFSFYPKTIEEMTELGLVAYDLAAGSDDYEFVKWRLSFNYSARPIPQHDITQFPLSESSAKTLMEYRSNVLSHSYNGYTNNRNILLPGVSFTPPEGKLSGEWQLNRKFFTNPYTGEPMKRVPRDSPSLGDFSVWQEEKHGRYIFLFHYEHDHS